MKTTLKYLAASFAAIFALVSCQKETATTSGTTVEPIGGAKRVILATMNTPTKAYINDFTPYFIGGDQILVSNEEDCQTCTIYVENNKATFTTDLTGTLTAVYPADAAKMDGNKIVGVLVPTVQSGAEKDAIIAMAKDIDTKATFNCQTAIFVITPGAGDEAKYVEVITAGPEIANYVKEGDAEKGYDTKHKIHVDVPETDKPEKYYISILIPEEGLKVKDLSFADGVHIKAVKGDGTAINCNTLNTVSNSNWDTDYVDVKMIVNEVTRTYKWATMNIGATSATEAGKYFAWGDVVGQTWIPLTGEVAAHWSGTGFITVPTLDPANPNPSVLPLSYDAANINWGGSWRMPTKEEFDALASETKVWDSTNKGYTFGTSPNTIFLPAAGAGYGAGLDYGGFGYYWSSSLDTGNPNLAFCLGFYDEDITTYSVDRFYGLSVRALSE